MVMAMEEQTGGEEQKKPKITLQKVEDVLTMVVIGGAVMLSVGIGSTAITTRGLPAIISMLGAVVSFTSTVALVFTWAAKEFKG